MTDRYPSRIWAFARRTLCAAAASACTLLCPALGAAQESPPQGAALETRASLTAMADAAERAGRTMAARNIRARLAAGDFREGNRLVVEITNAANTTTTDTITVRPNQTIAFKPPVTDELALGGVLRSEVEAKVTEHVAKWYRTPTVRVTPLIRLGIIGSVQQPGYKDMSPTALITDIVTKAGGYSATADPDKIIVRRGAETVWQESEVRIALTEGYSIDRFSLRDGDEIQVPQKQQRNWMTTVQFVIGTASLLVLLITQTR